MNNQLPRSLRHLVRSIQLRLFYPFKQWGSQPNRNSQLRVFILAVGVVLLLGAFTAQAVRAVYQPGAAGSFLGLLSSSNFTLLPVIQVIPPVVTPQTIPHGEGFRGLSPATVAATSALKWQKSLPRGIGYGGITFSGDYQFLYFKTFGTPQGKVFKVRTSDGSTVWETDPAVSGFGSFSESGATIDEAAGRVYTTGSINSLPSGSSIIAALKISDGSLVWVKKVSELDATIGNIGNCIILLSPDKSRLYVRDDKTSSNILAINSATGQLIWKRSLTESSRYQTIGPVWQSATNGKPQIGFVNNSLANSVGVLQDDGSSSSIVWTKNVAKSLNYHWWGNGSTNADNSRLYVTSFSDGLNPVVSALDTTTGNFAWQLFQTASNGMNQFQNCAVGADGTIYSPGRKGSGGALTAIRPDGTIKWQYVVVGSAELISWPVVTTNGIVYVADNRNILFGIKDEGSAASPVGQWQLGASSGDQAPSVGSDGTLYVTSGTNDVAQVLSAYSPSPQDIPDLQVSGTTAPAEINTDASFRLSWMVKNIGKLRAEGIGRDKIYLSTNNQFDPGVDTLLGEFPLTQALDPGQSIERTQPLTIPRNKIPSGGQYYLIVYADANNNINEGGNEINNVQVIPVTVKRPALPDLAVQSIEAPATAFFDQTITVRWTVKNIGGGSTNASGWQDWVYLSSDEVPETGDPFRIPVQNISYLAAGESYVASADVRIPRGLAGAYKIIVYTDFDGTNDRGDAIKVKEENELNNWDKTKTIQINIPLLPDLTVTTVQTPDETFAGATIPLSWRIDNKGGARTEAAAFTDRIYLAKETTFNPATARLIGENKHTGLVAANDGYNVSSFTANIPFDIAGDWNVFIFTDAKDEVYEFVLENNNSNYDRRRPLRIRATPPDLIVPSVTAPATATAARQIAVNWTVKNQGAFDAAPGWTDAVYLSTDNKFDAATDTLLGVVTRTTLAAGQSYSASLNATIPACLSGAQFIFVVADSRKEIFEYDPTFDAELNNVSTAKAIQLTATPPDLQVTAVTNPASGSAGQPIAVSWTVANRGTGPTIETSWSDTIYLSRTTTFSDTTAIAIATLTHDGNLNSSAVYSRTENIPLPNTTDGAYYLFVRTDSSARVEECSGENNNLLASPTVITINNQLPDLKIVSLTAPASSQPGQVFNVAWTGQNTGTAAARNTSWSDSVYLSTDQILDGNDRLLGAGVINNTNLAINATYQAQRQVTLPNVTGGNYYLIVQADTNNFVFEGQREDNNIKTSALRLDTPPTDLVVSNIVTPADAYSGQEMPLSWTVTNSGTQKTSGAKWTDYVYISQDQIFDPTDPYVGYFIHDGELNAGAGYPATARVTLPRGLAGTYYVFVQTDGRNLIPEFNENNNVVIAAKTVNVQLSPIVDLTVTNITMPASGSPGDNAAITWTAKNQSANKADGRWTDAVYLSKNNIWDINDSLIGRVEHDGYGAPVAAGATYTASLNAEIPAVEPGNYYVIIRADVRNNLREENETNNDGSSTGTIALDVTTLTLGIPRLDTLLKTGAKKFYKVNVPADETMRLTLTAQDKNTENELYTRFGLMPSLSAYDYLYNRQYNSDQEITVPNTQAGNYYSMARAGNLAAVSGGNDPYSIKAEIIPFSITSVSPNRIGDNGQVTITLKGAKFEEGSTVKLVNGNTSLTAVKVWIIDSATIKTRFYFAKVTQGDYDVVLTTSNSGTTTYVHGVVIEPASQLLTDISASGDLSPRIGRSLNIEATVFNQGNVDVPYTEVSSKFTAVVKLAITRPSSTLPKISDSTSQQFSSTFTTENNTTDIFIVRDLEPGQRIQYSVVAKGYNSRQFFTLLDAIPLSKDDYLTNTQSSLEAFRIYLLSTDNQIPEKYSAALKSANEWWKLNQSLLIQEGYLDQAKLSESSHSELRQIKSQSLAKIESNIEDCKVGCDRSFNSCLSIGYAIGVACLKGGFYCAGGERHGLLVVN